MIGKVRLTFFFTPLISTAIQLVVSYCAFGQAWVPPKGIGTVTVSYQYFFVQKHIAGDGVWLDAGHITTNNAIADFNYSLTNKLAISVVLPYVASKYDGNRPHKILSADGTSFNTLDNGRYNTGFQDFSLSVRYNLRARPLEITPFVRAGIPSHDYEFFAHSAIGLNLREMQFGVYAGRLLEPFLPEMYVQGRYSYGFVEKVLDISHNRSNVDLELGYFVTPSFRMFSLATGQITHGGVVFPSTYPSVLKDSRIPIWRHHDQIQQENSLNVGAGAAFSLNTSTDIYGAWTKTVAGRNIHAIQNGLTVGMSWAFNRGLPRFLAYKENDGQDHHKYACLCAVKD